MASRSVESLERSAADAIFPRHANGVPLGSGAAHTNVPRPDVSAQQTARLEFPIGADDRGAADAEALGQLALGRQTRSRRQFASRDRRFEQIDEVPVKRPRGPHELTLDLLKHRPSRTSKCGPAAHHYATSNHRLAAHNIDFRADLWDETRETGSPMV